MAMDGVNREAILTGCVDSFCLVCEEYLKCERDVAAHVTKPVHRKNLLAVNYMDKYSDDHIRKVKRGYFCEFCNLLLPTAAKVGLHVSETHHVDNKGTKLLKRVGNSVVALGNVSISERAWHGLMEDTCVICNVEYDNENIHKNEPTHIIRLIQCKVQYGSNKTIYRLIDNDSFQCLTCNKVLSLITITEHLNYSDHQKLYLECLVSNTEELSDAITDDEKCKDLSDKEITSDINVDDDQNLQDKDNLKNEGKAQLIPDPEIIKKEYEAPCIINNDDENRKKILDSVNNIQKSDINIDFETQSAFCKKCLTALDFNYEIIDQHMQEHKHKPNKMVDSSLSYPTVDQNHNKISLTLCDEPTFEDKSSDDVSNIFKHNIRALNGADDVKSENFKDNDDIDFTVPSTSENKNKLKLSSSEDSEGPSVSEDASKFAKMNQMTYSESCRTAYCRVCEAKLPATLAAMKEHVAGSAHTIRTNKTSKPKVTSRKSNNYSKQSESTKMFVKELIVKQIERVIINRKYSLGILSFMLVTIHDSTFRCQVCEVNFIEEDCGDHMNSFNHKNELNKIQVITSLDNEFVREVRPGLFHCGYCHLLVSDWEDLRSHMKCSEHKTRKTIAKIILNKHLGELEEEERMERVRQNIFLRMMMGNPFIWD